MGHSKLRVTDREVEGVVLERTRYSVSVEMTHEHSDRVLMFKAQLPEPNAFRVDVSANTVTHDRMVRLFELSDSD
jgi:hypothetical protein